MADLIPVVVGVKMTEKSQVCDWVRVTGKVPQVPLLRWNKAASALERAMLLTVTSRPLAPLLLMVKVLGADAMLRATLPKLVETGVTVMAAGAPMLTVTGAETAVAPRLFVTLAVSWYDPAGTFVQFLLYGAEGSVAIITPP